MATRLFVTHQANRDFYEKVLFSAAPRSLQPDRLFAFNPDVVRDPVFEMVNQKYVLSDGTRTLDLYPVQGLGHATTMLVVYLPKEKILVNADLYSPPAPGDTASGRQSQYGRTQPDHSTFEARRRPASSDPRARGDQ